MKIEIHEHHNTRIAEVISDQLVIRSIQDGLDLLGDLYYQEVGKIILHQKNIAPDFFDLKTGIAGEILQKFSNYRMPVAIIGDFSNVQSKSLQDFIRESNKGKWVNFVESMEEAITKP